MKRITYKNDNLVPGRAHNKDYEADPGEVCNGTQMVPNSVSSLCDDGLHRPALDIDIPMTVVPSSTPGHCHLYFDEVALTWPQYEALLIALADAGIIEQGYLRASQERTQTILRLPGVRKTNTAPEWSQPDPINYEQLTLDLGVSY
jgi:hypothetical protein